LRLRLELRRPNPGILRPHLYFDDQATHLTGTATNVASVHVPFGKINA
jgi:5'-nucleotidase